MLSGPTAFLFFILFEEYLIFCDCLYLPFVYFWVFLSPDSLILLIQKLTKVSVPSALYVFPAQCSPLLYFSLLYHTVQQCLIAYYLLATWPFKSPPSQILSPTGISLMVSSSSSQNIFFSSSLQPTCGAYTLSTLIISSSTSHLILMILSDIRSTFITPFFSSLSRIIPTPFLLVSTPA